MCNRTVCLRLWRWLSAYAPLPIDSPTEHTVTFAGLLGMLDSHYIPEFCIQSLRSRSGNRELLFDILFRHMKNKRDDKIKRRPRPRGAQPLNGLNKRPSIPDVHSSLSILVHAEYLTLQCEKVVYATSLGISPA